MSIESRWLIKDKVIYSEHVGGLTLESVKAGSHQIIEMFDSSSSEKIHVIANQERLEISKLPNSLQVFKEVTQFIYHPKMDWFLLYPSENQFVKFATTVLTSMAGIHCRQFNKLEECIVSLTRVDPTLPPIEEIIELLDNV